MPCSHALEKARNRIKTMQAEIDVANKIISRMESEIATLGKEYVKHKAEIDELKVLLEAKDHVIDCAIDLAEKTEVEGFYATSDVYVDFRDALKPFMPDVKVLGHDADIEMFGYGTEDLGDLGDK